MKKVINFIKKNWLTMLWGATLFGVSIEVFPPWVAWASLFLPFMGWIIYKMVKK